MIKTELPQTAHLIEVKFQVPTNYRQARIALTSLISGEKITLVYDHEFGDIAKQATNWLVSHCFPINHYGKGHPKGYIFSVSNFTSLKEAAKMGEFFAAYIECMLWADTPENAPKGMELSADSIMESSRDCAKFYHENARYFGDKIKQAGHDFWLTRNRHGSGFWDREEIWGDNTQRLTDSAHKFGEISLEVSDRGELETI